MKDTSGLCALKIAVDKAGAQVLTYVPGYPINEIAALLKAEISTNEKVAMEIALGASATGRRALVIVKQVGMNVLLDPLLISATHTIGSGLVVLAGDDLGPKGSQSEMDSRYFGQICELPVMDPKDADALCRSVTEAYRLSEDLRVPAIIRITSRLISSISGSVLDEAKLDDLASSPYGQRFDRSIWELTARGRHQRHHLDVLPRARAASESTALNSIKLQGEIGILASGRQAKLCEDLGTSLLCVGYTYPLPWTLVREFLDAHRLVLVAEEPEPVIESQLRSSPKIRGKLSGHLPFGPVETSDLIAALESLGQDDGSAHAWDSGLPDLAARRSQNQKIETVRERGSESICEGCPFSQLYLALARLDVSVAGDAGCSIRATREPFDSVDLAYGLGSAVAVASGFEKKGVAIQGDYAFAHSGLQGLISARWKGRELLLVLVKNGVSAMTGGQEVPDLTPLLETLVPTKHIDLPCPQKEIEETLKSELERPGITAVVASGECIRREA